VRRRWTAAVALGAVGVAAGTWYVVSTGAGPLPGPEGCSATLAGTHVGISTEQAENASTIAAIAVRRGLPARAVSIALATAFQESKLRNLSGGDRDSVGLFQQRESQGWGTKAQIMDPYYAANAFYDALVKVQGYQAMRITEAAQAVQRSGFPEAYEAHAAGARVLASALTGYSPARFTCVVDRPTSASPGVMTDLQRAFGPLAARHHGRTVDVSVGSTREGWAVASYLVAQAKRLNLDQVEYRRYAWSAGDVSKDGWRHGGRATGPAAVRLVAHR
jgi:hypothetical protein